MGHAAYKSILLAAVIAIAGVLLPGAAAAQPDGTMSDYQYAYDFNAKVESPTRNVKSVYLVADNLTIFTAVDIEAMQAHSVTEILDRVPGLFISHFGMEPWSPALAFIQGGSERHVLFMVDNVKWNFLSNGNSETNQIPVQAIDRIEIVKGPVSSVYGSALNGLVRIYMKKGKQLTGPSSLIQGSSGEGSTSDVRLELTGWEELAGFYIYAGAQKSNCMISSRGFESFNAFANLNIRVSPLSEFEFSIIYGDSETDGGDIQTLALKQFMKDRPFFTTFAYNAIPSDELRLNLSIQHFKHRLDQITKILGSNGPGGQFYQSNIYDEAATSASGKLIWDHGINTIVFGVDYRKGSLEQTTISGGSLVEIDAPPVLETNPDLEEWAIFYNQTIVYGKWAFTPGIRFDWSNIVDWNVSPSLGVTYIPRVSNDTVIRASISSGFSAPPLVWSSGGGLFLNPNSSLKPEEILSVQAGVESNALKFLRLKATVFHNSIENSIIKAHDDPENSPNHMYINSGIIKRAGFELEAETKQIFGLSLWGGFSYVKLDPQDVYGASDLYTYNLALRFDKDTLKAELFGHYIWWDINRQWAENKDDVIFDLNVSKRLWSKEKLSLYLFAKCHNLFGGEQYELEDYRNPGRWFEAGFRFKF